LHVGALKFRETKLKFQPDRFYMHRDARDLCLEIKQVEETQNEFRLEVMYWNLGYCGTPWLVSLNPAYITIYKGASKNWVCLDVEDMCEPRFSPGLPFRYRGEDGV
jgi:hypothetical protein